MVENINRLRKFEFYIRKLELASIFKSYIIASLAYVATRYPPNLKTRLNVKLKKLFFLQ